MNESDAYAEWTIGGYVGRFRPCWKADHLTVYRRNEKGKLVTAYFKSKNAAECAAWRELRRVEQPVMVRDGVVVEAQTAADTVFKLKPFTKQRGNGQPIKRRKATA